MDAYYHDLTKKLDVFKYLNIFVVLNQDRNKLMRRNSQLNVALFLLMALSQSPAFAQTISPKMAGRPG